MGFFDSLFNTNIFSKRSDDKFIRSDADNSLNPNFSEYSEEFAMEPATDTNYGSDVNFRNDDFVSYTNNGVHLREEVNTLRLTYNGILAGSGAQEIYAVIGYGNNMKWESVEEYPMHNMGNQTFDLVFPVKRSGNINIAFRDSTGNWDNNSGMNYSYNDQSYRGSH